jgi:hypothetical protein
MSAIGVALLAMSSFDAAVLGFAAAGFVLLVILAGLMTVRGGASQPHASVRPDLACPNCGARMEVGFLRTRGLAWTPFPGIWRVRGLSVLSRKYSTPGWRCVPCALLTANYGA